MFKAAAGYMEYCDVFGVVTGACSTFAGCSDTNSPRVLVSATSN
jgi:hypothetical protein